MHQSGSRAKFVGVTWRGNDGQVPGLGGWGGQTPDYYVNVEHAFESSGTLRSLINSLSKVTIAAHSLGNMLVSSAICDQGLSVDRYYMIDAAVAQEAFDTGEFDNNQTVNNMRHPNWADYERRLWASHWHELFADSLIPASGDKRHELTWRGRFGPISNAYNFYSSEEEVLRNGEGVIPPISVWDGISSWTKQEMSKGTMTGFFAGFTWDGGWDFNHAYNGGTAHNWAKFTPDEAGAITDEQLRTESFFLRFDDDLLYDPALGAGSTGSNAAQSYPARARKLAEAVPAITYATGANSLGSLPRPRNIDMASRKNGNWPRANDPALEKRGWLHSDFKNVSYYHVWRVYKEFVETGGLDSD